MDKRCIFYAFETDFNFGILSNGCLPDGSNFNSLPEGCEINVNIININKHFRRIIQV